MEDIKGRNQALRGEKSNVKRGGESRMRGKSTIEEERERLRRERAR